MPHACRTFRLAPAELAALRRGEEGLFAPSGRAIFRAKWLQRTHTLLVEAHCHEDCAAAVKHLRSLRTLRCDPYMYRSPHHRRCRELCGQRWDEDEPHLVHDGPRSAHNEPRLSPTEPTLDRVAASRVLEHQVDVPCDRYGFKDEPCAFYQLPLKVLVHTAATFTFDYQDQVMPLTTPIGTLVLQFDSTRPHPMPPSEQLTDANGQIIQPRQRHCDPADRRDEVHKLILNANDPVCKHLAVLLPIPNSEGNASDMVQPLQRLALWAAMGTLSLTIVGGLTDACAPLFATDRVNGIRRLFESTTKGSTSIWRGAPSTLPSRTAVHTRRTTMRQSWKRWSGTPSVSCSTPSTTCSPRGSWTTLCRGRRSWMQWLLAVPRCFVE